MTIRETVQKEIDALSGMTDSIKDGVNTPLCECVPLSDVWADV